MIRVTGFVFGLLLISSLAWQARAATTLKMATLAPERSPWGKVFQMWSRSVLRKTDARVEITWLWNGNAGPETTALAKVKTGQLAGAAVSGTALGTLHKPVILLQVPGLFASWDELDRARQAMHGEFSQGIAAQGFTIGGWSDVGVARIMSQGFAVHLPADLRGKHPGYLRESLIAPKVFAAIGGVTPRAGGVGEVLGLLTSGAVDVIISTPLATEQLQWASRLTHMNTLPVGYGIGAIVFGEAKLGNLQADDRELVASSARRAGEVLAKQVRQQDDEALVRLRRRLRVHEPSTAERDAWARIFGKACRDIQQSLPANHIAQVGGCR